MDLITASRDDGRKPDNAEQRQAKQHEEDE